MTVSRRLLFGGFFVAAFIDMMLGTRRAFAETLAYSYDAQGRLIRVVYTNGATVDYVYDEVGNRTSVVRSSSTPPPPPSPPAGFSATVRLTSPYPINLRTLADFLGYNGAQNATITFEVPSGLTIKGAAGDAFGASINGSLAIDTGSWPTGSHTISLTLSVLSGGKVYGGGGGGGRTNMTSVGEAEAGGAGGDAVYCRLPMSVSVASGGQIRAGGGGGGGGGGWYRFWQDGEGEWHESGWGGGKGGGGFANGASEGGNPGTASGGGASQAGFSIGGGRSTGASGAGGNAGDAGASGSAATGSNDGEFTKTMPAAGGAAGWAIRKNGHAVTVNNSGAITGAVG